MGAGGPERFRQIHVVRHNLARPRDFIHQCGLCPDNPDSVSVEAQREADRRRGLALAGGRDFATETVFSHPSKLAFLAAAQRAGFYVVLLFICTEDPALNASRVLYRIESGGHGVPLDRIRPRYERALANVRIAILLADELFLYDNTPRGRYPRLVARFRAGALEFVAPEPPLWLLRTFGDSLLRSSAP